MLRRTSSASAAMVSGYRQREALGACTESLGSESGDVGGEIDQLPAVISAGADEEEHGEGMLETHTSPGKRQRTERPLPPAMPRVADAFMRAERRGGRLILTEVVRPPERPRGLFRASRADGRLLLRFAEDEKEDDPCYGSEEHEASAAPAAAESAEAENGVMVGGCYNGMGFRQAAAGGAERRVEIGAVMGI